MPPGEYVGRHIAEFHLDQPCIDDILTRLTRGETLVHYPARLRHKDGSVRNVEINSKIPSWRTQCFTRDISERKRIEERDRFLVDLDDAVRPLIMTPEHPPVAGPPSESRRQEAEVGRQSAELERRQAEGLREDQERLREAAESARAATEEARGAAEEARHATIAAVQPTAESMQSTLESMKTVEDMRRTMREIRDLQKLDPH